MFVLGDGLTGGFAGFVLGGSMSGPPIDGTVLADGCVSGSVSGRSGAPPADSSVSGPSGAPPADSSVSCADPTGSAAPLPSGRRVAAQILACARGEGDLGPRRPHA